MDENVEMGMDENGGGGGGTGEHVRGGDLLSLSLLNNCTYLSLR